MRCPTQSTKTPVHSAPVKNYCYPGKGLVVIVSMVTELILEDILFFLQDGIIFLSSFLNFSPKMQ